MSEDEPTPTPRRERWYRFGLVGVAVVLGAVAIAYGAAHHSRSTNDVTGGSAPTANSAAREALLQRGLDPSSLLPYTHYLYFSTKQDATADARGTYDGWEIALGLSTTSEPAGSRPSTT